MDYQEQRFHFIISLFNTVENTRDGVFYFDEHRPELHSRFSANIKNVALEIKEYDYEEILYIKGQDPTQPGPLGVKRVNIGDLGLEELRMIHDHVHQISCDSEVVDH